MFSSFLRRVAPAPAVRGEARRASVREMAVQAGKKKKRTPIDPMRGWVPIRAKLEAVPLHLPTLQELKVVFGRCGNGHTAARHFVRQHLPQFKFLHPKAEVSQRNSREEPRSHVTVRVLGADPVEVDVTGLANRSDVLRKVLEAGKMSSANIELAVAAAKEMKDVTVDSSGYMGNIPVKTHGTPPRVVHVPQKKKEQEE